MGNRTAQQYEIEPILIRRQNPGTLDLIDSVDPAYITHQAYESFKAKDTPKMSIGVLGYRYLEQTKRCVESILRFVGAIDYELILVDNASDDADATLRYYQSVPTLRKKIIQVKEAVGTCYGCVFGTQLMYQYASGDIFVFLGNDNIITENALQNMLACLESSDDIGLVTPMSSNAYMLQNPGLQYRNYEEMFQAAKRFNQLDPHKWEDRLLTVPVATAIKREALISTGFYDFYSTETGLSIRLRQAGYQTLLLGDTWVCHDHDYSTKKDTQAWLAGDENAKHMGAQMDQLFSVVTGGLKQFEDIMVFEKSLVSMISVDLSAHQPPDLLALDVRAGQGLLDLKNRLRNLGIFETNSVAYTTQYKYHKFLDTTADEVFCDRIEYMGEHLNGYSFDYILIGEPINMYKEPIRLLQTVLSYLSVNGQLLFKIRNTSDIQTFLKLFGQRNNVDPDLPVHIAYQDVIQCLNVMGMESVFAMRLLHDIAPETKNYITELVKNTNLSSDPEGTVVDILTKEYMIHVIKTT